MREEGRVNGAIFLSVVRLKKGFCIPKIILLRWKRFPISNAVTPHSSEQSCCEFLKMESSMRGITVESAGRMTTYELRQEIERRGLVKDLEEINHTTLLRRLVQVRS